MSHAENPMSGSMGHHRTFEVLTAEPVGRRRKPRHWSEEDKARLVGEALSPGAAVSAIARSHGLDPSQVYAWRRKALASGMVAPLSGGGRAVRFARFEAVAGEAVEIVIGDVVVRVGGDVEPERLAAVIRAVRQA